MRRLSLPFSIVLLALTVLPVLANAQFKRDAASSSQGASARDSAIVPKLALEGFGTRQQPFVVRQVDPVEADALQRDVLRALSRARGGFWRTISRSAEPSTTGQRLEQVKVEFAYEQGAQFIRDTVNVYFDMTGVEQEAVPKPEVWLRARHAGLDVTLPAEIGWLHFQSSFESEREHPGTGWTFAYGAPGIKATIFIYNRTVSGIAGGPEVRVVRDEFERSRREMLSYRNTIRPLEGPRPQGAFLTQLFKIDDQFSLLAVTAWQGYFLKLRLTHEPHMIVTDMANQSVDALLSLVQKETRDAK